MLTTGLGEHEEQGVRGNEAMNKEYEKVKQTKTTSTHSFIFISLSVTLGSRFRL